MLPVSPAFVIFVSMPSRTGAVHVATTTRPIQKHHLPHPFAAQNLPPRAYAIVPEQWSIPRPPSPACAATPTAMSPPSSAPSSNSACIPSLDGRFVSSEFPSFDIRENMATPGFVSAYFQDRRVWTDFSADSIGLGSRRQRVNQRHLLEQFIWLPPLGWQRQISRVLQELAFVAPGIRKCNKGSLMAATLDEALV